jgi:acetyl esterase/lipase
MKTSKRLFHYAIILILITIVGRSSIVSPGYSKGITNPAMLNEPITLWPNGAPGAVGNEPADIPTLTPYFPKEKATGAAIIVCPGGGYSHLADHEGGPVAEWLNSIGIAAFVLKYRLGPRYHHPAPMQDAERAIRTVRARAAEWKIDPKRIGILGFSAGGHVASTAGTHFDSGQQGSVDLIERVSSRPDLMVLVYPVITMRAMTHAGSKHLLLGDNPPDELVALMSNEEQVTKETPPTFLVHTANDAAVPVENSLHFAEALRKAGVPFELHVYERGPHGFGLGGNDAVLQSWPRRCADWLRLQGF